MDFTVDYYVDEAVIDVADVRGGIRILVDGERLNRYQNESDYDWQLAWRPEFAGEYVHEDLNRLVNAAAAIMREEIAAGESCTARLGGFTTGFRFEICSPSDLRATFEVISDLTESSPVPTPESESGYVVERNEACRAVAAAAHDYLSQVRSFPLEFNRDYLEDFQRDLDSLDEALDDCE